MKKQKGIVLVMALVFLVIMTLLGTAVMSDTALQEKMAGNLQDRSVAVQASYSSLAACESWVIGWATLPTFDPTNGTDGLHLPSPTIPVYDPDSSVWESTDVVVYDTLETALNLPDQPVCVIEHLGTFDTAVPPNPPAFKDFIRISAKGYGRNNATYFSQSVVEK